MAVSFLGVGLTVTTMAAAMVSVAWAAKEAHKTQRRLGEKKRWKRAKKNEPTQKDSSEMPDLYRRGVMGGYTSEARPRPT